MQNMLLAGFGGQGVLFMGKIIAYAGLIEDKCVSWLPSYGPEMRGGTANCSVCISDQPIGSPLVLNPDVLVAMNLPSYEKFINKVVPGGIAVIDSALVHKKCERTDISCYYVPATTLADSEGLKGLANILLLGKVLQESKFASFETVEQAIMKCVPAKKQHLAEPNMRAIKLGMSL
ncbi:2-oxoacid:acceptor oxidoreductase family protein [Oscillospiraceae bacterium PP1C4]